MSRKDNLKRLILKHQDRLQVLKEQQAQMGLSVDPRIPTEIADIESEIEALELELEAAPDTDEAMPPFRSAAPMAQGEPASAQPQGSGGVQIGSVGGDIKGSIIASGNVSHVQMSLNEQHGPAEPEPTLEAFQQLLTEIRQELTALKAEQEGLKAISSLGPRKVENAQEYIEEAVEVAGSTEADGETLLEYLEAASDAVGNVLEKANKKIETLGGAVKPITEQLEPLLKKLVTAAAWAVKLYMLD